MITETLIHFIGFPAFLHWFLKKPSSSYRTDFRFLRRFAVALLYYGISLGMDALGSQHYYINLAISAFVEGVGYALSWFLSGKIGRKRTYSMLIFLTSVSLISTVFPVLYGDKGLYYSTHRYGSYRYFIYIPGSLQFIQASIIYTFL